MTIGKRRHQGSVTALKSFIMSDKQTAKMHEAAQRQLFHMSDVQEDLRKKIQQAASRKLRASIRQQRNKGVDAYDQPRIRCRHKNIKLEENAHVNHQKLVGKESIKEGEIFGHLLMLAESAELLQSEGQSLREESLDKKQENGNVKKEKNDCSVLGRTRLTQIRHQARLENHQRVEDLISVEDSDNCKNVKAEQLQGVLGHRDAEDPFAVAKRSKGREKVSIQACVAESLRVNNEQLHQHSVESNVIVHQSVHMTQELKKLTGHRSKAHQQRQVRADTRRQVRAGKSNLQSREHQYSSQQVQVQVHAPFNNQTAQSPSLLQLQLPEAPKDRPSIARQRRMLRTFERRKQRYAAKFQWMANVQMGQMYDAHQRWLWHVMNAQNGQNHITKQQWSLYMSYLEKEKNRGNLQQRRAQKIEERAAKKMHQQLTSIQLIEQSRFEEKAHGPYVSTGAVQDPVQTEINQSSQHSTMHEVCEDQNVELQHHRQVTIIVEDEKSTIVEGRMRLTRLKREARLKNFHRLDRESEKKFRRPRNKGYKSIRS